jgi:hypothetical protein
MRIFRRDVFNERYFEALERRRDAITVAAAKRQSLVWIGMLFLGLSVLSVHVPVSMFGLSVDAKNLREILLLALSTLQVAGIMPELEKANITDHLFALVSFVSRGDETAARALRLRFGIQPANMIPILDLSRRSGAHHFDRRSLVASAGVCQRVGLAAALGRELRE